jgi:tetratricopeptide (TPR) repeat protein
VTSRRRSRTRADDRGTARQVVERRSSPAAGWWPILAIVLLGILTYANALGNPFVFDDPGAVVDNPTIRSLGSSLRGGPVQTPTAGRPLVKFSFAVNYLFGGTAPSGYHAVNLGFHIACALLLFGLTRRLSMFAARSFNWLEGWETPVAAAVALVWTVHPLNSEIVDYVTQRTEAMMAFFFLATLYCGVRASGSDGGSMWPAISVVACAAGMTCKESMVIAPVMMLLLESTFEQRSPLEAVRRRPVYYASLFATWIILAVLIVEGPRWRSAGFSSGISPWTYLLNQAPMIARYLRLVFWPTGLVLDYGEPLPVTLTAVLPSAILVVAMLAATVVLWRLAPVFAFPATWFFLTLAPTSSVLPIATEVGAERRMYLPLVPLLFLLALGAVRALGAIQDPRTRTRVGAGLLAAVCAALAVTTIKRNREYSTTLGIWQSVIDRRPTGRAHHNLGLELKALGRRAEAIEEYRRALAAGTPNAHYALAFELGADGRHDEAIEHYRAFISLRPVDIDVPRAYHQIGRSLLALRRPEEAATAFREVLARRPGNADALGGLGDALMSLERWEEAVTTYTEFLRIRPSDPNARFNMGLALVRLDRDAEARDAFATVVQLRPDNVAAHVNLAYALANTGRLSDSVREFRRAAELEPDPASRQDIEAAIAQLVGH